MWILVLLVICFFIFLFVSYGLSKDDYLLLKKNINVDQVFDMGFVLAVVALLFSRLIFVAMHPNPGYFNPFIFLGIPYYPGLSLSGGGVGGVLFLLFLCKYQKLPMGRLLDFFSISFLSALPVGIIGYILVLRQNLFTISPISLVLAYIVLFIVFIKILLSLLLSGRLKDGTIGLIFLICFAIISLVGNFIGRVGNLLNLGLEDLILIIALYASTVFLFRQEKLLTKIKKFKLKRN